MEYFVYVAHELLNPYVILLMLFGCVMGIVFGAIPGLNADLAVTLMLPISFGMSTTSAFALLISSWVGGVSGSLSRRR
ncbi:hypothetical protein SDC9_56337 [bioreactor metagenome]|uniref:DUF112 domain-containing protein n=1 Tax=bioreactor metagenome TaxID=1076179 RepID=A0A644X6U1_9ZZZZ